MASVGLIGLGIIGTAFARHLLADGDQVVGFDILPERRAALAGMGGIAAASPREVADQTEVILTAVASLGALESIASGPEGLIRSGRRGFVVAEVSTLPIAEKESVRGALEAAGIPMLDCTISGTGLQAEARQLVFMASGDPDAIVAVTPVLQRLGKAVYDVGAFGNGSKMKFVANLLVAVHTVSTAEALLLAERAGLDLDKVMEVIGSGVGSSRMWEIRAPLMVQRRFQPPAAKVSQFVKDTHLITDFARSIGVPTPLLDQANALYEQALDQGLADWEAAAVHTVLSRLADG
jgi:3-hydroxyisobutyrate dehydrogenase-like beta-hydroxyacid dehydrogenase